MALSLSTILLERSQSTPNHIALWTSEGNLSYAELYHKAAVLAQKIIDAIGPANPDKPEPIGLLIGHNIDTVIGIFGAIFSGRCYSPLDPNFPESRLLNYLNNSGAPIIITEQAYITRANALKQKKRKIIVINELDFNIETPAIHSYSNECSPAYLLYTSGTTGEPKGVWHNQQSVIRAAKHYRDDLNITAEDKVAAILPISYTPSVFCIFGSILFGATLCPFDVKNNSIETMIGWIERAKITLLYSTPTIFRRLLNQCKETNELASLRSIQLAGEPLYRSDIDIYKERFSNTFSVYNGMGTTETSCLTRYFIDSKVDFDGDLIPIGRAYDDVDVTVIDENGKPVSPGDAGQLMVSSHYFAQGYWGKPELTKEKFTADHTQAGLSHYCTGDLVRLSATGDLIHLGRMDSQIKLHGQRIELEEIETVILQHPDIEETAVLLINSENKPQFIAAFFAPQIDYTLLREWLCTQLPPYMIPTRLASFDTLPITITGKIDRFKLGQFNFDDIIADSTDDAANSSLEKTILDSFRFALKTDDIGLDTDFFHAGGDSMKGIELAIDLEKKTGTSINASTLIEAPTPRLVARFFEERYYGRENRYMFRFASNNAEQAPSGQGTPIFCFPGRGGGSFTFLALSQALNPIHPMYAFEYGGDDNNSSKNDSEKYRHAKSVHTLADICVAAIMESHPTGPVALISFSLGGVVAYEAAQKLNAAGREISLFAMIDCYSPSRMRFRFVRRRWNRIIPFISKMIFADKKEKVKKGNSSDDAKLMDTLETAVFLYRASPLNLKNTLLLEASKRPKAAKFFDNYKQWYQLIDGEIQREIIEGEHVDLVKQARAPRIASIIEDILPKVSSSAENGLASFSKLWSFHDSSPLLASKIEAQNLPINKRELLNSSTQLTKPLTDALGEKIKPQVITSSQIGRYYYRKVILKTIDTSRPTVVATLKISMDQFEKDAREKIISLQHPFGDILTACNVDYSCKLLGLFRIEANESLCKDLEETDAKPILFGRHNQFIDENNHVFAEVIEVLASSV